MGHSMGCLTINSYLGCNPAIASRISGVIYSAPFFGMSESMAVDPIKKAIVSTASGVLGEFLLICPFPLHRLSRDKQYVRSILHGRRS